MVKKAWKRWIAPVMAVTLCFMSIPFSVLASGSTLDKLNKAQEDKKQTESQLNQTNQHIDGLEDVKQGLQGELNQLSSELQNATNNLEKLEQKIKEKEADITQTQAELQEAEAIERKQYQSMKQRIKFMYERGDSAYLEIIFSAGSFSDFLNKTEYINQVAAYDRKMLEEYQTTKEKIASSKELLEKDKKELNENKLEVEAQQKAVSAAVGKTSDHITGYANQISDAEAQALLIETKMKQQESDIAALKKQYEQELALSKLAAQSAKRDISEVTFAEGDLRLLATIIYCESGGEPYAGQLAVGAVVINRVLSSRYPDTVLGVIYQRKQFSPVGSGRFDLALANNSATASCYQAAQEAMNGMTNVGGCVYFRTPIEGLTGLQIGGHIFY